MPDLPPHKTNFTEAVNHLRAGDPRLAAVIDRVGPCLLERRAQGITALVYSVAGQQLSGRSARAIRSRLDVLFGNNGISPEQLASTGEEALRTTGLSRMKIKCLHSLADHVLAGTIDFQKLETMDDEAIITVLSRVKGIGRWTAEMYLIFALLRPDVFPIDDFAIRTAMTSLYGLPKTDFNAQARQIAESWRPFRTVACWYLYRYLGILRDGEKQAP